MAGIKLTALLTAKPGMTRDGFIDRYERFHAPLIVELIPYFERYRRNFLREPFTAQHIVPQGETALPFHSITEMWYRDAQAIETQIKAIDGEIGRLIAEDEEAAFDRQRLVMYATEEHVTPPGKLKPRPSGQQGPPQVKLSGLLCKASGMAFSDFRDYYENSHAVLALDLIRQNGMPLFANYSRSFVLPDQILPIGAAPGLTVDFDVITDMWFWTQDDLDAFIALTGTPDIAERLVIDERRLFDRDRVRSYLVDQHDTDAAAIAIARSALAGEDGRGTVDPT